MRILPCGSFATIVIVALAAGGCGDDGGGAPPIDAPNADADPTALNGCTQGGSVDLTAAGAARTITSPNIGYTPSCIRIKAGQSVTWNTSFAIHPLSSGSPGSGPDPGSPITETTTGASATFAFPDAGRFGFWCEEHGTAMMGAIYVEP